MSVNIHIAGRNDFHCPIGRRVEEVTNIIRSGRGLIYGEIQRNGVVMFPNDIITSEGDYHFVNFQEHQGICFDSLLSSDCYFFILSIVGAHNFQQGIFSLSLTDFFLI